MATTQRTRAMVARLWRIVEILNGKRRGMTVRQLMAETSASRATIYRAIGMLEECGVAMITEPVNGEVRYRLDREPLPALRPNIMQFAALVLARDFMEPLEGTTLVKELDALIATRAQTNLERRVTRAPAPSHSHPAFVAAIDRGIRNGRRLRLRYRAASSNVTATRFVDPAALRVAGDHVYLVAWDIARDAWRTFKLARVLDAHDLDEPVTEHPAYDDHELFDHAVRIWSADPVDVSVRIAQDVAWLLDEWPLHAAQRVEPCNDGAVIVHARVSGLLETKRWILRWGKNAEALAPPELRAMVHHELTEALHRYDGEPRVGDYKGIVSTKVRHDEVTLDGDDGIAAASASRK